MQVTAIEARRKSLLALYIDGEYAVSLDRSTLEENGIKVGTELDDCTLRLLIQKSVENRAKSKALWLLSYRDYTKKELKDKISRDFTIEEAERVSDRMEELGLLNDERFAKKYAGDLLFVKHLSKKAAKYKMLQRGIANELCDQVLDEIYIEPKEQIKEILDKKYSKYLNDEKGIKKTFSALQRMGYGYSDIRSAMSEFTEEWIGTDEL